LISAPVLPVMAACSCKTLSVPLNYNTIDPA